MIVPENPSNDFMEFVTQMTASDGAAPANKADADAALEKPQVDNKTGLKRKSERLKAKPVSPDSTSVVRNVPKVLLQQIRVEFPEATNHTDALVAYLMCHGDGSVVERTKECLTDEQRQLIANWDGSVYTQLVDQISTLVKKIEGLSKSSDILELLMTYMVFDRLGFRRDNPVTPKNINFREDGVVDVNVSVREQQKSFSKEVDLVLGRPLK